MTDFFDRLENELRAATARQEAPARASSSRRLRPRGRLIAVLAAALIVVVPASAAVIEAFRPYREPDNVVRTAPKTVIATGEDPEFGAWEAFTSDTSAGECFGIRLLDPPGPIPGSTMEGCGTTNEPARVAGGDGPERTALFGFAPGAAAKVRIEAEGNTGRTFPTYDVPGRTATFFFASLPANPEDLPGLRVVALTRDGRSLNK